MSAVGVERCGFRCECGFEVRNAIRSEAEWIGTEHRALMHGDEEGDGE